MSFTTFLETCETEVGSWASSAIEIDKKPNGSFKQGFSGTGESTQRKALQADSPEARLGRVFKRKLGGKGYFVSM